MRKLALNDAVMLRVVAWLYLDLKPLNSAQHPFSVSDNFEKHP